MNLQDVVLVSLYPTFLTLIAFMFSLYKLSRGDVSRDNKKILGLLHLIIFFTLLGYFWFLVMYPNLGKGDTIKASYILHLFPFLAILMGFLLTEIKGKSSIIFWLLVAGLFGVFVHNIFSVVTYFPLYAMPWSG